MSKGRKRRRQKAKVGTIVTETAIKAETAVPDCLTPEEKEAWLNYFKNEDVTLPVAKTTPKTTTTTTGGTYTYKTSTCIHNGTKIVVQLDDINIFCGAKPDIVVTSTEYDAILDVGANIIYPATPILEVAGFGPEAKSNLVSQLHRPKLVSLNWPDMGVFPAAPKFWRYLWNMFVENDIFNLLIACQGSHGRTGTALAALMVCCHGYAPAEAAELIHREHCRHAIETNAQINYLNHLYQQVVKEQKLNVTTE